MARPQFTNNEFYHVFNRGVDKRVVFKKPADYRRFALSLLAFNDTKPVANAGFHANYWNPISIMEARGGQRLVDIICFCLMPNHFHLLLRQVVEGGISKFLQKVGVGYTNYFNTKYERSGVLFQGKFKASHVGDDVYIKHLSRYIHLNPLELVEPEWKHKGVGNWKKAHEFLRHYGWSSYGDFAGCAKWPYLLNKERLVELFGDDFTTYYPGFLREWTNNQIIEVGFR